MSAALPADLRGRALAVARELGLTTPEISALPGGGANIALRLRDAGHDLVLRIAGAAGTRLGASRVNEGAMQALAAGAGLAPELLLARPAQGLLVSRYVAGRRLAREDLRDPVLLALIGRWAARLHALPPPADLPYVDFGARAAGYLETLGERTPSAEAEALAGRLAARRAALPPVRAASCHHDLHHRNLILAAGGALLALDWEYAGPGDPAADLAACIGYHELGPAEVDALLAGYGGDRALRARLAALAWIFDCLWWGWNAVAAHAGIAPDAALQARLLARLLD